MIGQPKLRLLLLGAAAVVCLDTLSAGRAGAAQPSFVPLGFLDGHAYFSAANDVSHDGSIVVGLSSSKSQPSGEAFRWTASGGMQGLGALTRALPYSVANGISPDGSVIVGTARSKRSIVEAFTWTAAGGMQGIGFLPGFNYSQAFGVTRNAQGDMVVVGFSRLIYKEAFRWTAQDGMQGLGFGPEGYENSRLTGVSSDGGRASGYFGDLDEGLTEALRYTTGSQTLAPLGFGGGVSTEAADISANGSVVVGTIDLGGSTMAFRWEVGDPTLLPLGTLPGAADSEALGVSPDGRVVVGTSGGRAFTWSWDRHLEDPASAMLDVQLVLEAQGVCCDGYALDEAKAVAADGITIVGTSTNPFGQAEAFRATVPDAAAAQAPGAVEPLAAGRDFTCRITDARHLQCWGNFDPAPDPEGRYVRVAAGETHVCAISTAGRLACFGSDPGFSGKLLPPAGVFVDVAAGAEFSCALAADGGLQCWGEVPGAPPVGTFTDLDAGLEHACAVTGTGALRCFGLDSFDTGKLAVPIDLGKVTRVATGDEHTCAIRTNGQVRCWGLGELGDPSGDGQAAPPGGTFAAISAGSFHTCAIATPTPGTIQSDEVLCWGRGAFGEPDRQSTPQPGLYIAVAAGGMASATGHTCALRPEGLVVCWGGGDESPIAAAACPPGDGGLLGTDADECDGLPTALDKCPEHFDPTQADFEEDGIGDACDLCTGPEPFNYDSNGNALQQADEDKDGVGDNCDPCLADPSPACDKTRVKLIPLGLSAFGAGAAFATTAGAGTQQALPAQEFSLLIDCGSTPAIRKLALGIALTADVDPLTIQFGNGCTASGCPTIDDPPGGILEQDDPDDRLSDEVDPDNPDTFVLLPGDPGIPLDANQDALYFSMRAEAGSPGLCVQDENDVFLATITIGDLTEGFTPPFTTQGTDDDFLGAVAEDDVGGDVLDSEVELASGTGTRLTIELKPDFVDNVDGTRYSVLATANTDLSNVVFGLQGEGQLRWLGCSTPDSDVCVDTTILPRSDCASTGQVPPEQIGPNVDFGSPNTYTLGPAVAGADLSGLAGVQPDTLYVSLEAVFNVGFPNFRSLNPGAGTSGTAVLLGTVEFIPDDPQQGLVAPSLTFSGVQTLFDRDRTGDCGPIAGWSTFQVTDVAKKSDPLEGDFGVADSQTRQVFVLGLDPDGDNYVSDFDVCPFTPDNQVDTGGYESALNPGGASANGIGNACECGEVINNDGRVRGQDTETVQDILLGDAPVGAVLERCSTAGGPSCGPEDWAAMIRAQLDLTDGVSPACPPALP